MKKIVLLLALCLSTTISMAQFGDLDDILKKAEKTQNGASTTDNGTGKTQEGTTTTDLINQFISKTISQGFVAIRQDFRLADTIEGKNYNYGGDPNRFGGQISFLVKLDNGFIIPDEILHPWDYDPNYPKFKNKQYVPFFNRTSLLKVSQNNWKELEIPFWPIEEGELANGLKYVKDEEAVSNGFHRCSGYGKKEAWIVWLLLSEDKTSAETHCDFVIKQIELTLEKGKKLYKMEAPDSKLSLLGGVVVEPVFNGVGRVDFALVGVIGKSNGEYNMAVIEPYMAEEVLISEGGNIENLTPSEETEKGLE